MARTGQKPEVSGPTEIYLPQRRFYPEGFDLEVSDRRGRWKATWDPEREILSLCADPEAAEHTVVVQPRRKSEKPGNRAAKPPRGVKERFGVVDCREKRRGPAQQR